MSVTNDYVGDASFELQILRAGNWITSGIYDNRDYAIRDAKGAYIRRYLGVRVVEDRYDAVRDRFVSRTVFRQIATAADQRANTGDKTAEVIQLSQKKTPDTFKTVSIMLVGIASTLLVGIGVLLWLS